MMRKRRNGEDPDEEHCLPTEASSRNSSDKGRNSSSGLPRAAVWRWALPLVGVLAGSLLCALAIVTFARVNFGGAADQYGQLKAQAAKIHDENSLVMVQFLSAGYLPLTKSWICNVRKFSRVLKQTLFVASDDESYKSLKAFGKTHSINVVYVPYPAMQKKMAFGSYEYYDYMLFRTNMIVELLQADLTTMIIESDAVWTQDPTDVVMQTPGDIVGLNDQEPPHQQLCGGFQLIRPTAKSKEAWSKLLSKQKEAMLTCVGKINEDNLCGNEQLMFNKLLRNEMEGFQLSILKDEEFASGLFYDEPGEYMEEKDTLPIVIHNNWIMGIEKKIRRAKQWGHWFLGNDEQTCTEPEFKAMESVQNDDVDGNWNDLADKVREAAEILGFDEELWDQDLPIPLYEKSFDELTPEQKAAVELLEMESFFES